MDGEEKGREHRHERLRRRPRPPALCEHVSYQQPEEHHVGGMQEDARQVIPKGLPSPDRRVEHQRCEVHRPVEVEHVAAQHPEREHVEPVPRIVQEGIGEDLQPRVVDEVSGERRGEHCQRNGDENRGLPGHGSSIPILVVVGVTIVVVVAGPHIFTLPYARKTRTPRSVSLRAARVLHDQGRHLHAGAVVRHEPGRPVIDSIPARRQEIISPRGNASQQLFSAISFWAASPER